MGELPVHSFRYSPFGRWWFNPIEPVRPLGRISADRIHHGGRKPPEGRGQWNA
jgi:hypothetical protein